METQTTLEGVVSIVAALESQNRPIERLLIQEGKRSRPISYLRRQAMRANIPVEQVANSEIDTLAGGKSHGGAIAICGERKFCAISDIVNSGNAHKATAAPEDLVAEGFAAESPATEELILDGHLGQGEPNTQVNRPFIVMLDGIEDPFNFGYAVRALYAAGVTGLIVRPRNWLSAAGTVARASAGASERMPTAVAESAEDAATTLRTFGLTIACTAREGAVDLYAANLSVPLFLVIGGEKRGITRSFVEQADLLLHIPYGRSFSQSMGTAAATSVLAFEVMRQRRIQ